MQYAKQEALPKANSANSSDSIRPQSHPTRLGCVASRFRFSARSPKRCGFPSQNSSRKRLPAGNGDQPPSCNVRSNKSASFPSQSRNLSATCSKRFCKARSESRSCRSNTTSPEKPARQRAPGRERGLHPRTPFADSKRFIPRPRNPPFRSGNPFVYGRVCYFSDTL